MAHFRAPILVMSLVGLAAGGSAQARRATSPLDLEQARNFDLARHVAARTMPRGDREREDAKALQPRFAESPLGPRWSYQVAEDGPSLEFSALGAGRNDGPRLVQVGVDWQF
ncbi:hypothetical protein [Novosphingobium aquimarinum]|uniref:hypothetical protein n=1 Tax=Novosphingobium aquimarinum TaxID=2682494 RepID=UPI0012EB5D55|nr:hypothetical protein [Novosphingobium aquimarinum]